MIFLIYGEDDFLIKIKKNNILKKINPNNNYYLQEYDYLEDSLLFILNDANTIPMFSDKKIIIVKNSFFITEEKKDEKINNKIYLSNLINYFYYPNINTYIIFICPTNNISMRLKITKKIMKLNINIFKIKSLSHNELINFINKYVIKKNGNIKLLLINTIIEYLPNNLYIITNELNKLLLINLNITIELINNNITKYLDTNIFKLVIFLLKNDLNNFLISYYYLQERGLNNIILLTLISKNVIFIRNIVILNTFKKTQLQIAKILKINFFLVKKILKYVSNFNFNKINNIIKELFLIDYNIKKGIMRKEINNDFYFIKLFI